MLTDVPKGVTAEAVAKELEELELQYKTRRKVLRALLAVLETEKPVTQEVANEHGD